MDEIVAERLFGLLRTSKRALVEWEAPGPQLDIHPWVNDVCLGILGVKSADALEKGLRFVLVSWYNNNIYLLVIRGRNVGSALAQLHQVTTALGRSSFSWRYIATKRDGKNNDRKRIFEAQSGGSCQVTIELPNSPEEVDAFLEQVFELTRMQERADSLEGVENGRQPAVERWFLINAVKQRPTGAPIIYVRIPRLTRRVDRSVFPVRAPVSVAPKSADCPLGRGL